MIPSNTG